MSEQVWAVVELMGHVRHAGILMEEERFGVKMGRVDIPDGDGKFATVLFGGQSVYRITIVTEVVARQTAKTSQPAPVSPWDYPKQIANEPDPYSRRTDYDEPEEQDLPY